MALPLEAQALEELPEGVRDFYAERDGVFRLDVEGVADATKLSEFREHNIELRKKLERYDGLDPERYAKLLEDEETRTIQAAKDFEEKERLVMEREEKKRLKVQKELDEALEQMNGLQKQMADRDKTVAAIEALEVAGGYPSVMTDHVVKRLAIGDDGKVIATGLDGEEKAVKELVEEMRDSEEFRVGFKPTGATGGGATGHSGGGAAGIRTRADLTTDSAVSDFISENGYEAFMALPRE